MLRSISHRFMGALGIFVLFGLSLTSPVGAAVYCVDSAAALENALSQAATNSADDEIQIVRGTYVGNFVYASTQANALSVKGGYAAGCASRTLDPANTILDGNQTGTVLVLSAGDVAAELLVQGVTLRNGNSDGNGGGLYASAGTYGNYGAVTVEHNNITDNATDEWGGGIFVDASFCTATVANNHIQANTAYSPGGGMYVWAYSGTVAITNNYIQGNASTIYGGGISVNKYSSGTVTLINNTLVGNESWTGAGLYLDIGYNESKTSAFLYNNLFWDNTASDNLGTDLVIKNDDDGDYLPVPVTLLANNFDQTETGFKIDIPIAIDPSNLDALDPLFVDAANGDLHLTPSSPMIDAGHPQTPDLPATDLDGVPRVLGAAVDIGAYEYNDGSGVPDFQVAEVVLTPANPTAHTLFDAQITVKNQGTAPGVPGLIQVWSHQPNQQACNAVGDASTHLTDSLNPGDSVNVTVTGLIAGTAGSQTFRVFVDSECETVESPETNNQATKTYTSLAPEIYTFSLSKSGQGVVTSVPAGINCGSVCSASFEEGTDVQLTATPDDGYQFDGWSGDCAGTGTCTVAMTQNQSVLAIFSTVVPPTYSLTVSKVGVGTVTSVPAGIDCGTDCSASLNSGTSVTLTAVPASSATFSGWTGCTPVAGTPTQCTVSLTSNRTVTATFAATQAPPDNAAFAAQQYRDFLEREGDAEGLAYWRGALDSGAVTRAQTVDYFFRSQEFQDLIAPVARLYFAYFDRIPDYNGLTYWSGQRRAGASLDAMSATFAASPEFAARYGALDNAGFVDLIYRNVLGRAPEAQGRAYWIAQLNAGLDRGQTMTYFSESPEYLARSERWVQVTMIYVGLLRRAPEREGFDYWVGELTGGRSVLDMIGGFLDSGEYAARF